MTTDYGRRARLLRRFPIGSAAVHENFWRHHFAVHRERVKNMRPAIDTTPPEDFTHFQYNAKRAMQQAERLYEIDRENRILLSKMERYNAYTGSRDFRPWTCRASLNYKPGAVYSSTTQALHVDNMNVPVNAGTPAGGNCKSNYKRRKELEHLAKENLKVRAAIQGRRPVYSAQRMEHEYLEHVSRVERLATFRGPKSAQHLPKQVKEDLDVAVAMRDSKWLPGTAGYQRDLAKTMSKSMKQRQGCIDLNPSPSRSASMRRPATAIGSEYVREAARSMNRAATLSRNSSIFVRSASRRAESARPAPTGLRDAEFAGLFNGGQTGQAVAAEDVPSIADAFPAKPSDAGSDSASFAASR